MDDETRAYLDAMEARLMAMEAPLLAMEARLMDRMNDNQERLLERMRTIEMSIGGLTEIARNTNTLLSVLTANVVDLGIRMTRLEGKP
jgi:hypothetical protein